MADELSRAIERIIEERLQGRVDVALAAHVPGIVERVLRHMSSSLAAAADAAGASSRRREVWPERKPPAETRPNRAKSKPNANDKGTAHGQRIAHAGKSLTLTEWALETGLPVETLRKRRRDGWAVGRMLDTPLRVPRPRKAKPAEQPKAAKLAVRSNGAGPVSSTTPAEAAPRPFRAGAAAAGEPA